MAILGPDLFAIARAAASPIVSASHLSPLVSPEWSRAAFRIDYADGTVVKGRRFESDEAADRFVALSRLSRLSCLDALPRVLAHHGCAVLVEWTHGVCVSTLREVPRSLAARAGATLRALHDVPIDRAPWADAPSAHPGAAWRSALVGRIERLRRAGAISNAEGAELDRAAAANVPPRRPTCIVLGDVAAENMVVDDDGHLHMIDTDGLQLHVPEFDIARTWYRWPLTRTQWQAFEDGYDSTETFRSWQDHFVYWTIVVLTAAADFRLRHGLRGVQPPLDHLRKTVALNG
ncbi:MAG: phosphotransferase family protein [Vicinamibacterales bacterium]